MQDQLTCTFTFRITPISITENLSKYTKTTESSSTSNSRGEQSILFKLGSSEGKSKKLGQPVDIKTSVLYSKTLNKFCPIKGLIKIYDKNKDGSQMISCVGAFNTDELINNQKMPVKIEESADYQEMELVRNIGPSILTMRVSIKREGILTESSRSNSSKFGQNKKQNIKQNRGNSSNQRNISLQQKPKPQREQKFSLRKNKEQKNYVEGLGQNKGTISNGVSSEISNMTEINEENRETEFRIIAEQLVLERRLTKSLEQKSQELHARYHSLLKKFTSKQRQFQLFIHKLSKFTEIVDLNSSIEINVPKQQIILKYNSNKKNVVKQQLTDFFAFVANKIIENQSKDKGEEVGGQEEFMDVKFMLKDKEMKIRDLEQGIINKNQQLLKLQTKIRKIEQDKKVLEGINQYLQEKDTQMQSIIAKKQTQIQSLKKVIAANNQQFDILEDKNLQQNRIIENLELIIEETKEEVANSAQIIENYRKKYGDLKEIKDRALERDLRECLHWIDQYRTEQMSEVGEQTTNNSFNILNNNSNSNINVDTDSSNSMTSLMMKSIDQIQEMPLQQISHIRRQVVGVLKRLDEFLAKAIF